MTAMVFPRAGRLVDIFGSSVLVGSSVMERIVDKVTQVCGGIGYDAGNWPRSHVV